MFAEKVMDGLDEIKSAYWFHSQPATAYRSHPKFIEIVEMGHRAIPYIMFAIVGDDYGWICFDLLGMITGKRVVPKEHAGDYELVKQDWLDWYDSTDICPKCSAIGQWYRSSIGPGYNLVRGIEVEQDGVAIYECGECGNYWSD